MSGLLTPESNKIIEDMLTLGYEIRLGTHVQGPAGFYAAFYKRGLAKECPECGEFDGAWDTSGHATDINSAIKLARGL